MDETRQLESSSAAPSRGISRRAVVIGLGVTIPSVLVAGGVGGWLLWGGPATPDGARGVVDAYLGALRDGDTDRAISFWDAANTRVHDWLREQRDRYRRALAGKSWSLSERNRGEDRTVVIVRLKGTVDDSRSYEYVVTRREDASWRIWIGPDDPIGDFKHSIFQLG